MRFGMRSFLLATSMLAALLTFAPAPAAADNFGPCDDDGGPGPISYRCRWYPGQTCHTIDVDAPGVPDTWGSYDVCHPRST